MSKKKGPDSGRNALAVPGPYHCFYPVLSLYLYIYLSSASETAVTRIIAVVISRTTLVAAVTAAHVTAAAAAHAAAVIPPQTGTIASVCLVDLAGRESVVGQSAVASAHVAARTAETAAAAIVHRGARAAYATPAVSETETAVT